MARKRTRRNDDNALVKFSSADKPAMNIDVLGCLIESRDVDASAKDALDRLILSLTPGTHSLGAFKLCRAADEIEDGDFLFSMAQFGFGEALGAHTMERLICNEAPAAIVPLVEAQAAMIASASKGGSYVVAEFADGNVLAVNGTLLVEDTDEIPSRPDDLVLDPSRSGETEINVELDTKLVAKRLAAMLKLAPLETGILRIIEAEFGPKIHASATGDVQTWAPKAKPALALSVEEDFYGSQATDNPPRSRKSRRTRRAR